MEGAPNGAAVGSVELRALCLGSEPKQLLTLPALPALPAAEVPRLTLHCSICGLNCLKKRHAADTHAVVSV